MDRDSITRTGARAPGVERNTARAEVPTSPIVPDTEQGNPDGGQKARRTMANPRVGKAPSDIPAFKPYRGKPAVRNFRGGDGDVGMIRSPVRAIAAPLPYPTANQRTYGSVRGVPGNRYPYRD